MTKEIIIIALIILLIYLYYWQKPTKKLNKETQVYIDDFSDTDSDSYHSDSSIRGELAEGQQDILRHQENLMGSTDKLKEGFKEVRKILRRLKKNTKNINKLSYA